MFSVGMLQIEGLFITLLSPLQSLFDLIDRFFESSASSHGVHAVVYVTSEVSQLLHLGVLCFTGT